MIIKKHYIIGLSIFFVFVLILVYITSTNISENKNNFTCESILSKDLEDRINVIIINAVSIQYGNKNNDTLKEYFTQEFINNIDDTFYKNEIVQYNIMNIVVFKQNENNECVLMASVRIGDDNGVYIQEITFEYLNNKYYIKRILYDI